MTSLVPDENGDPTKAAKSEDIPGKGADHKPRDTVAFPRGLLLSPMTPAEVAFWSDHRVYIGDLIGEACRNKEDGRRALSGRWGNHHDEVELEVLPGVYPGEL